MEERELSGVMGNLYLDWGVLKMNVSFQSPYVEILNTAPPPPLSGDGISSRGLWEVIGTFTKRPQRDHPSTLLPSVFTVRRCHR